MPYSTLKIDIDILTFIAFSDELGNSQVCPKKVSHQSQLGDDCYESADTPKDLFTKLRDLNYPAIVIPHGNTWGFYTPPASSLDKQLDI